MSLQVIEAEDTPEGTLKAMLVRYQEFDGVIVISLNKDGSQHLMASRMSMHEKCFLIQFAQNWINSWFRGEI